MSAPGDEGAIGGVLVACGVRSRYSRTSSFLPFGLLDVMNSAFDVVCMKIVIVRSSVPVMGEGAVGHGLRRTHAEIMR